jgi:sialidase-1
MLLSSRFAGKLIRAIVNLIVLPVCVNASVAASLGVKKLKDVVIYRDDTFYSAFPSIVRRPDGELLVSFRRAPERRNFGNAAETHTDACSQLMLVRSSDQGETWTKEPQLLFAHPRGGLQDPCMLQLDDDSILCSSYGWALIPSGAGQKLQNPVRAGDFVALGGVLLRSTDGGRAWAEIALPPTRGEHYLGPFNKPLPACNRGAMCQGRDGRIFWVTVMEDPRRRSAART